MIPIGPYSRPDRLAKLDGRTKEARMLAELRAGLLEHIGGEPTLTQKLLIERCSQLALQVALMERSQDGGALSERNSRQYLAWSNSLVRSLRALGLDEASARKPRKARRSLADMLAERGLSSGEAGR